MSTQTETRVTSLEHKVNAISKLVRGQRRRDFIVLLEGAGDPNGVVSAVQGVFYWDSTNQSLYLNTSTVGTPPEGTTWCRVQCGDELLVDSLSPSIVKTAINYNATTADHTILVDASAGNRTVNLPALAAAYSSPNGLILYVKKIDSSGNTVTLDGSGGETIDGAATFDLLAEDESVTVQAYSDGWYIL